MSAKLQKPNTESRNAITLRGVDPHLLGSYPQTRGLDCRVGGDDGTLDATAALEGRGRERDGTRLMMDWGLTMMISDAPS